MEKGETDTSCIITTSLSYIATSTGISHADLCAKLQWELYMCIDTCVSEKYMLHYCMVYCVVK